MKLIILPLKCLALELSGDEVIGVEREWLDVAASRMGGVDAFIFGGDEQMLRYPHIP